MKEVILVPHLTLLRSLRQVRQPPAKRSEFSGDGGEKDGLGHGWLLGLGPKLLVEVRHVLFQFAAILNQCVEYRIASSQTLPSEFLLPGSVSLLCRSNC